MLPRPLAATRPISKLLQKPRYAPTLSQIRHLTQADIDDPGMVRPTFPFPFLGTAPKNNELTILLLQNGGYPNPPPQKRQFRDPYGDWWDKQERRNFGEPVHEDHDVLGVFSLYEYTHFTSRRAFFLMGCFITSIFGLCGVVSMSYPDKPSAPRTFEGGLDRELGGKGALLVSSRGSRNHNLAVIDNV